MERKNGRSKTFSGSAKKASSRRTKPLVYTHRDADGMRWRFVGSLPVSELADQLMEECGFELY
jgi:hypothetical protein